MAIAMNPEEKAALQTAISIYLELGVLNRVCSSCEKFLSRVPANITTKRLKSLIENHGEEIAKMAGAKTVIYKSGYYKPSGRGAFGHKGGGDRAKNNPPSIEFIF
ncbi:hypothetical protein F7734_53470 [Scytonema sp. UIC 10036]|uniref:hypothetical protein n=1 Tax=Scytonema sp. UIC 10036 TaxID=2304196 RepID=UPI0012DA1E1F|nr:hypothetical protein [Scytonema sp. UIC 10036]MUH00619.1 hypothetical protein [Scytonema sp. UIC 10036]